MSLLDPNITKYVLKWKNGIVGGSNKLSAKLLDVDGNLIGILTLSGISKKKVLLTTPDSSPVLSASKKTWMVVRTYEVKDQNNKRIGIVKPKSIEHFEKLSMYNSNKEEILTIHFLTGNKQYIHESGLEMPYYPSGLKVSDFEIHKPSGKKIAKITLTIESIKRSEAFQENFYTWTVDELESSCDRKILLAFLICFFSSAYDSLPKDYDFSF